MCIRDSTMVEWRFNTVGLDIGFGHQWLDSTGTASPNQQEIEMERCSSHLEEYSGSVISTQAGSLTLVWDNSYSWMNAKTLNFSVHVSVSEDFEQSCMRQAIEQARKNPRVPLGCILLQRTTGEPVATGYCNQELFMGPLWRDVVVCLEQYNRLQNKPDLNDLTLYTTAEPDAMSWGAIALYGIKRVVFGVELSRAPGKQVPIGDSEVLSGIQVTRFKGAAMSECETLFNGTSTDFM
eukprot:TRINITY_DN9071_c0_g2_i1.p1 TRINITY_DN9071_c0_g2~~TRINITY_DN9071_c0_g2_i1.p1  ORF type:complete len:237 (+),score=65.06 TRINITY_DN9071_c0_g2_i1:123-833(+)